MTKTMLITTISLLALLTACDSSSNNHSKREMDKYKNKIEQLTPLQRNVTQNAGTEPPFDNEYHNHFKDGIYRCIVCETPIFDSESKFFSRCGWPAFSAADSAKVTMHEDLSFGMERIEVRCAKCGAHLGHLFYDGPTPSRERYCINSAALHFVPQEPKRESQ